MLRETKFGYGFLLVGTAAPYLIDKVFGLSWAILLSVLCLIVGGVLLWSGHWQKDGVLVPFKRWQEWVVFGAALTSFTVLLTIGATRAARQGEALKAPDTGIEKQRPASSPPAKPKLVLWTTGDEGPLEYVIKHHPIEGDSPLGFGLTLRNQGTVTANRIRFRVEILTSSVDLKTIPPFTNQSRGPNDEYILYFPFQHQEERQFQSP